MATMKTYHEDPIHGRVWSLNPEDHEELARLANPLRYAHLSAGYRARGCNAEALAALAVESYRSFIQETGATALTRGYDGPVPPYRDHLMMYTFPDVDHRRFYRQCTFSSSRGRPKKVPRGTIMVAQPYLRQEDIEEFFERIPAWCYEHGMRFSLTPRSWHCPGGTVTVIYWTADRPAVKWT